MRPSPPFALNLIQLTVMIVAVLYLWPTVAVADQMAAPFLIASSSSDAKRAERAKARAERRARYESEWRTRSAVRGLERQLERAEKHGKSTKRKSRYGSNDGQAGSHCMFGIDGKLIHAGRGSRCPAVKGGPMPSTDSEPTLQPGDWREKSGIADGVDDARQSTKPAPAPSVMVRTGCIEGSCTTGQGSYVWKNGSRYVGGFKKGRQHGQGTLVFANGASYTGAWRSGERSGFGTALYPDGRVQAGKWKENRFVGDEVAKAKARAKIKWPNLSRPAREVGGGEHDAAVIVGVEKYAHVAEIPGARRNANDWYRYLVKSRQIPIDRVTLLLDSDATREEIRHAAEEAAGRVGEDGSLWFVFVGHGAPHPDGNDGLLIGFDAQQKARSLRARSLSRADLISVLEQSKAENIHLLLDACFSGRSSGGEQLVAGLQPLVVTASSPTTDPRTTLMTAARSDQYAGPLPGMGRPAFSYLALGGLRGWADENDDGKIAASELHDYVSSSMKALIRGRQQSPTMMGGERVTLVRSARESGPDIPDLVLGTTSPAAR